MPRPTLAQVEKVLKTPGGLIGVYEYPDGRLEEIVTRPTGKHRWAAIQIWSDVKEPKPRAPTD